MDELIVLSQATIGFKTATTDHPLLSIPYLKLYKDQWILLHGPSGSGKTTLLAALAGYGHMLSGHIALSFDRKDIAYMPQMACLLEGISVRDNISMLAMMRNIPIQTPLEELAEHYALACDLDQSIEGLSGGERMKIALIRSLLIAPKVFFLDEPSCHWDAQTTHMIMHILKAHQHAHPMSIIMVSHDKDLLQYSTTDLDVRDYQITTC